MMKNIIIFLTITLFISCDNDTGLNLKSSIDREDNVAGINQFTKLEVGKYHNVFIFRYQKIIDLLNDLDDWYNSFSLIMLKDNIISNKYDQYYFSSSVKYETINNNKVADFLILSMFEVEDIRLERHIVYFNNNSDVVILIMKYKGGFDRIITKLYEQHYLIYKDDDPKSKYKLRWDYGNNKKEQLAIEIRENRTDIPDINLWYKNTEEIKYRIIK